MHAEQPGGQGDLERLRAANPIAVRHRYCTTVRVARTRTEAYAFVDSVQPPLRHRLRVVAATTDDIMVTLTQRQCRHVTHRPVTK